MKKMLTLLLLLIAVFTSHNSKAETNKSELGFQTNQRLFVGITTRSTHAFQSCEGDRGFCILVSWNRINNIVLKDPNMAVAEISLSKDGRIRLDILSDNSNDGKENDPQFRVFKEIELPGELANALGRESITLIPGEYTVDLAKAKFGSVFIKTK